MYMTHLEKSDEKFVSAWTAHRELYLVDREAQKSGYVGILLLNHAQEKIEEAVRQLNL